MLFKFLEKPIEITAVISPLFTYAHTYSPINYTSKFIPDWWKKTPKGEWNFQDFTEKPTTKSCPGIAGTFQNGFILPLWSDLAIKIYDDLSWKYQFSDRKSSLGIHPNDQSPSFYENYLKFKINSPWMLKTSENIKFIFCSPFYMFPEKNNYITPYGITPTINKTTSTNVFLFIENKPSEILIKSGTPLMHIIPLTEKRINFKLKFATEFEWNQLKNNHANTTFVSKGLSQINSIRKQKNG